MGCALPGDHRCCKQHVYIATIPGPSRRRAVSRTPNQLVMNARRNTHHCQTAAITLAPPTARGKPSAQSHDWGGFTSELSPGPGQWIAPHVTRRLCMLHAWARRAHRTPCSCVLTGKILLAPEYPARLAALKCVLDWPALQLLSICLPLSGPWKCTANPPLTANQVLSLAKWLMRFRLAFNWSLAP